MARCNAFILATTSLPGVAALSPDGIRLGQQTASEEDRRKLAFFRVWCLVELATDMSSGVKKASGSVGDVRAARSPSERRPSSLPLTNPPRW